MVNSQEFANRLQHIMDHYHLNGSAFAESIGVQRSAISHILSGRNKPSLEFVMKILETYPDIELYWLLNGKGNGPFKEQPDESSDLFTGVAQESFPQPPVVSSLPDEKNKMETPPQGHRHITKVVVFYSDNTFQEIKSN